MNIPIELLSFVQLNGANLHVTLKIDRNVHEKNAKNVKKQKVIIVRKGTGRMLSML